MTWRRLELTAIDPGLEEGLAARIADPLWSLARQWQAGEFRGEDAARPVMVEVEVDVAPIHTFHAADARGGRIEIDRSEVDVPLETLVQQESARGGPAGAAMALEAGAAALRRLTASGAPPALIERLRTEYPPAAPPSPGFDPVGEARLRLLARSAIDGAALAADLAGGVAPSSLDGLAGERRRAAEKALAAWLRDESALIDEPDPRIRTWDPRSLRHRFGLLAGPPGASVDLRAGGYAGGRLDWFHFDVAQVGGKAGGDDGPDGALTRRRVRVLPSALRYAGQPASRFWAFEEGAVDHGRLAAAPDDIARAVVAAFATVGGDDWFSVPCVVPVGSLARIASLRVLDDFGAWTPIASTAAIDGPERVWRWFELGGDPSADAGGSPLLFVAPVAPDGERGPLLERVDLRRDEMANLAWAVERRFEGPAGRPVERRADGAPFRAEAAGSPPPADGGTWRFRVASAVPPHWMPLVPVRLEAASPEVVLRRGRLALPADDPWAHRPLGVLLMEADPFILNEEEIPDGGTRLVRRHRMTRGADGRVHLWVGRRAGPGEGALTSGPLRFDDLLR